MISTQYINLNMVPSGVLPVLYCSQYDVGRPLGVVVYNRSEPVDLSGYTCTIEATRTDGTAITTAVTVDNNIGAFVTTATMTNQADKYPAKLVLFDSNSRRVASLAFMLCVTPATMDENAESIEEDESLYQQYTRTVQTLIVDIRENITDLKNHTAWYVTPEDYGAVGDGVTDDTAAVQAAIRYALEHNVDFRAPSKAYGISSTITLLTTAEAQKNAVIDFCGAELNVLSDITDALLCKTSDSGFGNDAARWTRTVRNLVINCKEKAQNGIHHVMGRNLWYENVTVNDVKSCGLLVDGNVKVDKFTVVKNLDVYHTYVDTYGIIINATDCKLRNVRCRDAKYGIKLAAASNFLDDVHCWLISPLPIPGSICFDVNNGFQYFIGCYADTYETGWDFSDNDNHQSLIGCQFYPNPEFYNDTSDTTAPTIFKFRSMDGANERVNIVGFVYDTSGYYQTTGKKVNFSNYAAEDLTGTKYAAYDALNKAFNDYSLNGIPQKAHGIGESLKNLSMQSVVFITDDLNNYKEPGFFGVFRAASAHFPTLCKESCMLMVMTSSAQNNDIVQVAFGIRSVPYIATRTYSMFSEMWTDWTGTLHTPSPYSTDVSIVSGGYTIDASGTVNVNIRFKVTNGTDSILFTDMPKPASDHHAYLPIYSMDTNPTIVLSDIANTQKLSVFAPSGGSATLTPGEWSISGSYMFTRE